MRWSTANSRAREVTAYRARQKREKTAARATGMRGSLEQMMAQVKTSGRKDFPLVIKADVQGSNEAIAGALEKLGTDEVAARILHSGVGGITESDVRLAETSNAAIIGFNVRANKEAREAAERAGIEIRYYNIIYNLVDDVKQAMSGLLAPSVRETMLGNAEILEVFKVSKVGNIAGCRVTDGTVERGANVRLLRDNVVIHEGKLSQLKRFKDDAREVSRRTGMRHGLRELPGHEGRRRHRMLPGPRRCSARCESKSPARANIRPIQPPWNCPCRFQAALAAIPANGDCIQQHRSRTRSRHDSYEHSRIVGCARSENPWRAEPAATARPAHRNACCASAN